MTYLQQKRQRITTAHINGLFSPLEVAAFLPSARLEVSFSWRASETRLFNHKAEPDVTSTTYQSNLALEICFFQRWFNNPFEQRTFL